MLERENDASFGPKEGGKKKYREGKKVIGTNERLTGLVKERIARQRKRRKSYISPKAAAMNTAAAAGVDCC